MTPRATVRCAPRSSRTSARRAESMPPRTRSSSRAEHNKRSTSPLGSSFRRAIQRGSKILAISRRARYWHRRCSRNSHPDRRRGHRRIRGHSLGALGSRRVRVTVAFLSPWRNAVAVSTAGAARLGGAHRRVDPRGRFRQRVSLLRRADRVPSGARYDGPRHLHGNVQQDDVSGASPRVSHRSAVARRRVPRRARRLRSLLAERRAGDVGRVHREGALHGARAPHAG